MFSVIIVLCYHYLNKNAVDKSYFLEFSESLITVVIELIFAITQWKKEGGGKQNNSISFSYLVYGLLRAKKLNLRKQLKDKFDIGVVLWFTHIYHYSAKSTLEISHIIEALQPILTALNKHLS